MKIANDISHLIDTVGDRAKYDESVKKLLSRKVILSWIMKICVEEFKDYSIDYIMNECIEGTPEVSIKAIHQDQLDIKERRKLAGKNETINGMNTEDKSIREHTVTYDIRFYACIPNTDEPVQMIINIEAQIDTLPGYPLIKRAIYYCCRMISAQYGTVFQSAEYGKIRKVYSIWICPTPTKKCSNTIRKYSISAENVLGEVIEPAENFDLMTVLVLRLGKEGENSENDLIRLLSVLLSATTMPDEKKRILHNEFNITMTKDFESEVFELCNLSLGILEQGIEQGKILGAIEALSAAGFSSIQITDILLKQYEMSKEEIEALVYQQLN